MGEKEGGGWDTLHSPKTSCRNRMTPNDGGHNATVEHEAVGAKGLDDLRQKWGGGKGDKKGKGGKNKAKSIKQQRCATQQCPKKKKRPHKRERPPPKKTQNPEKKGEGEQRHPKFGEQPTNVARP